MRIDFRFINFALLGLAGWSCASSPKTQQAPRAPQLCSCEDPPTSEESTPPANEPVAEAPTTNKERSAKAAPQMAKGVTVVVTGANRGLGLEFAKQLHERGYQVIGTARKPESAEKLRSLGVRVEQLDVADAKSVERFAKNVEGPVDLLINNAGIANDPYSLSTLEMKKPKASVLEETDLDVLSLHFAVNTVGPLRVATSLLPHLRRGEKKTIVNISSGAGSFSLVDRVTKSLRRFSPHFVGYSYRASKSALNMLTRLLAEDLRSEGFVCVLVAPDWARTDMGGSHATSSPADSVAAAIGVIEGLSPEDSGSFLSSSGPVPW